MYLSNYCVVWVRMCYSQFDIGLFYLLIYIFLDPYETVTK